MGATKVGPHTWEIPTDEEHVIDMESYLISAEWERGAVYTGQHAYFLIYTALVGDGSSLTVTCKASSGQTIGSQDIKIFSNYYRGSFIVPVDLEKGDQIIFEVSSSALKIDGASQPVPVYQAPYVNDMKWSQDEAVKDDIITLSASVHGIETDEPTQGIITIYWYDKGLAHTFITELPVEVVDSRIETKWAYVYHGDVHKIMKRKWAKEHDVEWEEPKYFFTVTIGSTEYGKEDFDSGFLKIFVEYGIVAHVLEYEDVLFYHNSAVLLPDRTDAKFSGNMDQEKATGISVISTMLRFADANKEKMLLITGHTDRSGDASLNFTIAKERAQSVLYILENSREDWADLSANRHTVYDIQQILIWAGYSPGPIDGIMGKKTKSALKAFQKDHGLHDDAVAGPKTFGVIFDRYQSALNNSMSDDEGQSALNHRHSINWAYGNTKAVGCGELFPKEDFEDDGLKSQTNRRVEALFFDQEELPSNVCQGGSCSKEDCKIFRKRLFKRRYIDPENIAGIEYSIWLQDKQHQCLKEAPFLLKIDDRVIRGFADKHLPGLVKLKLMTKVSDAEIFWGTKRHQNKSKPANIDSMTEDDFMYHAKLSFIDGADEADAKKCLDNLGYNKEHDFEDRIYHFQVDYLDYFRALAEDNPDKNSIYRFKIGSPWPDEPTKNALLYVNEYGTETMSRFPKPQKPPESDLENSEPDDDYDEEDDFETDGEFS